MAATLAPPPEFRLVGCAALPKPNPTTLASAAFGGSMATLAAALSCTPREVALAGVGSTLASLFVFRRRGPRLPSGTSTTSMTIVPWGVLLEDGARILHWSSIRKVFVRSLFARDQASDVTVSSVVFVETDRASYAAHAPGDVPIDRLLAYVDDYADEASHPVALDFEGRSSLPPTEPVCRTLIEHARTAIACPTRDLSGTSLDYRGRGRAELPRAANARIVGILRDRTSHDVDQRPLAALLAAEYALEEAKGPLAMLVQSPHPIVAATAKAAGTRLGLPGARIGTVDELGPFLHEEDKDALNDWIALSG